MKFRLVGFLVCLSTLLSVAGCSFLDMREQSEIVDSRGVLQGRVKNEMQGGIVYVNLYEYLDGTFELKLQKVLPREGNYFFNVRSGEYSVMSYADVNGNGKYDRGEPGTYFGMENGFPSTVSVTERDSVNIKPLVIVGTIEPLENVAVKPNFNRVNQNLGRVVNLNEPMFSWEAVSVGMWLPLDYLQDYGGGLMFLQAYDPNKTPILFVHGIGGSTLSFKPVLDSLDMEHFQPWVVQYPSGLSLDLISDYLESALDELNQRYGFSDLVVIAHSMGGLVTRSYVKKYSQKPHEYRLKFVMTINSPLYGMDSAASGVKHSPIVVPAWRDVASNSSFVNDLHQWQWPKSIPYFLIFSYLPGKEGDRVVPLKSQLSVSLQEEAIGIYGFESEHTAILSKPEFIRKFSEVLGNYQ